MSEFVLVRNKPTDTGDFYSVKISAEAQYGQAWALYSEKGLNYFGGLTIFDAPIQLANLTTAQRDTFQPHDGMLIWNVTADGLQFYGQGAWRNLLGNGTSYSFSNGISE